MKLKDIRDAFKRADLQGDEIANEIRDAVNAGKYDKVREIIGRHSTKPELQQMLRDYIAPLESEGAINPEHRTGLFTPENINLAREGQSGYLYTKPALEAFTAHGKDWWNKMPRGRPYLTSVNRSKNKFGDNWDNEDMLDLIREDRASRYTPPTPPPPPPVSKASSVRGNLEAMIADLKASVASGNVTPEERARRADLREKIKGIREDLASEEAKPQAAPREAAAKSAMRGTTPLKSAMRGATAAERARSPSVPRQRPTSAAAEEEASGDSPAFAPVRETLNKAAPKVFKKKAPGRSPSVPRAAPGDANIPAPTTPAEAPEVDPFVQGLYASEEQAPSRGVRFDDPGADREAELSRINENEFPYMKEGSIPRAEIERLREQKARQDELDRQQKAAVEEIVMENPGDIQKHGARMMADLAKAENVVLNERPSDFTPEEERARELAELENPNAPNAAKEYERLRQSLIPYITDKTSTNASNPYLQLASKNPANMHKDLMGDVEKGMEKSVTDQLTRKFNEDVLPGIKSKYEAPGLRQHGHLNKKVGKAAELFGRGLTEQLAKSKMALRGVTLDAALKHAASLGQFGEIASRAADKDRTNNLSSLSAAEDLRKGNKIEKQLYRNTVKGIGQEKRQMNDMMQEAARKEIKDKQTARRQGAVDFANFANKVPVPQPKTYPLAHWGDNRAGSEQDMYAGMMRGTARHMDQRDFTGFKKGGRIKKASGGSLQAAVQNAVEQNTDPLQELRRLMKESLYNPFMDEQKKPYYEGGSVSPIEKGAQEAKQFSSESMLRNAAQKSREKKHNKPFLSGLATSILDEFDKTRGRGSTAKISSGTSLGGKNKAGSAMDEADMLEYEAAKAHEASHKEERDFSLKEMVANAKLQHYKNMEAKAGAKAIEDPNSIKSQKAALELEKLKMELAGTLPTKDPEKREKSIEKIKEEFKDAHEIEEASKEALNLAKKVSGDQLSSDLSGVWGVGPTLASVASKIRGGSGTPSEITAFNKATHKVLGLKQEASKKSQRLAAAFKSALASKANYALPQDENIYELSTTGKSAARTKKEAIARLKKKGLSAEEIEDFLNEYPENQSHDEIVKTEKGETQRSDKPDYSKMSNDELKAAWLKEKARMGK